MYVYKALEKFFTDLHPEYSSLDFIASGISYGGKLDFFIYFLFTFFNNVNQIRVYFFIFNIIVRLFLQIIQNFRPFLCDYILKQPLPVVKLTGAIIANVNLFF